MIQQADGYGNYLQPRVNIDVFKTSDGTSHSSTEADLITGIISNGNIGIGESTPTARLHVKGANDLSTGNTMDLVNDSDDALFHVQNDGKVGIGTDDPDTLENS